MRKTLRVGAVIALLMAVFTGRAMAQSGAVNALCSTDQGWCEMAAKEFSLKTGIQVNQTRKATGEALAQLRAEAANPKTDIWWGLEHRVTEKEKPARAEMLGRCDQAHVQRRGRNLAPRLQRHGLHHLGRPGATHG